MSSPGKRIGRLTPLRVEWNEPEDKKKLTVCFKKRTNLNYEFHSFEIRFGKNECITLVEIMASLEFHSGGSVVDLINMYAYNLLIIVSSFICFFPKRYSCCQC